ncbi:MAG: patatin-like phospholipase family protein, partial [Chloroflexi bacterium]|nr:patatin-like phospholipase family protein [Chloroflexota bacterium]
LTYAWRFISGADSLSPNDNLRKFVAAQMPTGVSTFGDIQGVQLFLTTSNINTGEIFLFGEDPSASLVDAVLSSAAAPPLLPPIDFQGWQFLDGAICADVPISICVEKGATEVYAIDVGTGAMPKKKIHGIINLALRAIGVMEHQQLLDDFDDLKQNTNVKLHYLSIQSFPDVGDFDHADEFIAEGYRLMKQFLDSGGGMQPPVSAMQAPAPPGARKYSRKRRVMRNP